MLIVTDKLQINDFFYKIYLISNKKVVKIIKTTYTI